jgi:pimeloyl-ACP methyl ester carboxylesterase
VVPLLAQQARMVAVDAAAATSADPEAVARALAGEVAKAGAQTFGIVAQSACAELALWIALAHPEMVNGVVLVAPDLFDASGRPRNAKLAPRLAENKTPLLVLLGTSDATSPPSAGKHYRQNIPASNLVFVYDAAHDMESTRPAAVAAIMRDFLNRRDQFIVSDQSSKIYP